jgi:thiosulfate/3-mercaptopyruvate sulfurtransferase
MKTTSLAAALAASLTFAAPAIAQEASFGPLIAPTDLQQALETADPLILDIRAGEADGKPVFETGHIEGAVSAPYGLFRGPKENPGELVPEAKLQQVLRELGVTKDRPTVVVHQGSDVTDFGAAARVYWTLKSSGVSQLAILNGGINGWKEAKLDLATGPAQTSPSDIEVSFSDQWLATTEQVKRIVDGEAQATLLDARPEAFWAGDKAHPAAERPGTLPQSEYFTHSSWFGSDEPVIVDAAAARQLAEEAGLSDAETLVSFCNTGHWAATNWFALSELAGLENVKLYPESMVGWSKTGYDMANVPGPIRNMWNQIMSIFEG